MAELEAKFVASEQKRATTAEKVRKVKEGVPESLTRSVTEQLQQHETVKFRIQVIERLKTLSAELEEMRKTLEPFIQELAKQAQESHEVRQKQLETYGKLCNFLEKTK